MMGGAGLKRATAGRHPQRQLHGQAPRRPLPDALHAAQTACVAHEFILDCRGFKDQAGITVEDIAKRLMDYGFHAPTMSWPVPGTLMIEPTESESQGRARSLLRCPDRHPRRNPRHRRRRSRPADNPLKHAPHTAAAVTADEWTHPYTPRAGRLPRSLDPARDKFWPPVGRIDNVYGDRNLVCTCPPLEAYAQAAE